jgi:hypothetical protein
MEVFGMAGLFGLILGFMFGVGCAMAVLYTVYLGGYRKAVADSLRKDKSEQYLTALRKVEQKLAQQPVVRSKSSEKEGLI